MLGPFRQTGNPSSPNLGDSVHLSNRLDGSCQAIYQIDWLVLVNLMVRVTRDSTVKQRKVRSEEKEKKKKSLLSKRSKADTLFFFYKKSTYKKLKSENPKT